MWRYLALILAATSAAHAETYKWVDERGVVNYSNTPPPGTATAPQKVAERVSTYEPNPSLQRVAYAPPSAYEVMLQQEWLQRQRLMAERQNVQTIYDGAPVDPYGTYYRSAYPGYYPVVSTRAVRRVPQHRPTHHWR
jgi:hypothetical protein